VEDAKGDGEPSNAFPLSPFNLNTIYLLIFMKAEFMLEE
jgi:hypothetical protein